MLNKKPNYEKTDTVISKDTIIETTKLKSETSVQVNGKIIGDVEVKASLVIGQTGKVEGNIRTTFLLVSGMIDGNVDVVEQVQLTKNGVINGNIVCKSIVIDEGAVINGNCQMTGKNSSSEMKLAKE